MEHIRQLIEREFIGGIVIVAVFAGFAGFLYLLYRPIKFMRPQKARQEEQRLLSHQLYKGQSMMSNVHDNLKRLLPGFPISENTEQIRIVHPNDVPAEYEVIIKKNGSSYYLFAKYRGSTTFFTSVLTSNEATVGAYFLADKHLKCNPKPLHKWIRKDILYYQKWLSKKMRCPLNLEAIENLYIEIWELR